MTALALSVGVRSGPATTAVTGAVVARPATRTSGPVTPLASGFDGMVRFVLGGHCLAGKPRRAARQHAVHRRSFQRVGAERQVDVVFLDANIIFGTIDLIAARGSRHPSRICR